MSKYTFKEVPQDEVEKLVEFIDKHWKKGHALVKSKILLDFQHFNSNKGTYNFIVAENNETKEYDALVGFIPTSQYDSNLSAQGDYWGAIWKFRTDVVNDEINNAAFYVWHKIFRLSNFQSYAAIGISDIAKRIYLASRIPVEYMRHYYIANEQVTDFKVGVNLIKGNPSKVSKMALIKDLDIMQFSNHDIACVYRPLKSVEYIINRYKRHPIYHYDFWGVEDNDGMHVIFVVRKHNIDGISIYRIVDVLGNLSKVGSLYDAMQERMIKENIEYVDLMNFGLPEELFCKLGFQQLYLQQSDVIVPNYFEPFERRNVKIEIGYKSSFPYVAFKGDSDQDRPNIL